MNIYGYILLFGAAIFIMGLAKLFRIEKYVSDNVKMAWQCENLYHAQYAASMIEEEIRKIREEDYPWRVKYNELVSSGSASSSKESESEEE